MTTQLLRRLFSVTEYHRALDAGILGEDDRVELIEGEIIRMTPAGSRHAACVKRLLRLFSRTVSDRAIISIQDPIRLGEQSEPQPDLTLLRLRDDFYDQAHPVSDDVLLVVEVAESSTETDRVIKLPLYARHNIPEAWLVDIPYNTIEVYRQPAQQGYRDIRRIQEGQGLSPQAFPDLQLTVQDILG